MFSDFDKLLELENRYKKEQLDALNWKIIGKAPLSTGKGYFYDAAPIPYFEQFNDKEKMFQTQLARAKMMRHSSIGRIPNLVVDIRSHVASMFGGEYLVDQNVDTVWVNPLKDDLKDIVDKGMPSLKSGVFPKFIEYTEYFVKNLPEHYYLAGHALYSPFGIALDLIGDKIFMELLDRPDLVHQFLEIILETTFSTFDLIFDRMEIDNFDEFLATGHYYNGIRVDGDATISLSPEMIKEFEVPYMKKIAKHYNTKVFYHYCGNPTSTRDNYVRHLADAMLEVDEVCGINQLDFGYWYYLDNYKSMQENKFAVTTFLAPDKYDPCDSRSVEKKEPDFSGGELEKWLWEMYENTYGKSGIHLILRNIHSPEATKKVLKIWESF